MSRVHILAAAALPVFPEPGLARGCAWRGGGVLGKALDTLDKAAAPWRRCACPDQWPVSLHGRCTTQVGRAYAPLQGAQEPNATWRPRLCLSVRASTPSVCLPTGWWWWWYRSDPWRGTMVASDMTMVANDVVVPSDVDAWLDADMQDWWFMCE